MKRLNICVMIILFTTLLSFSSIVYAESTTINVSAVIQIAGSVTNSETLEFGTIIADPGGDTIKIDASSQSVTASTRISSATKSGVSTISTPLSGRIDVTLTVAGVAISIAYPTSVSLSDGGTNTLTVGNVAANSTTAIAATTTTTAATYYVHVGGELTIAAAQAAGTYTGTMAVTLNYN